MPKKRKETRKIKVTCLVCGKEFEGTAASLTCSGSCRIALSRIKAAKKRPEFLLMAKTKGQKIPDLNAPKRLKFKKGEKKRKSEILETEIVYAITTPKSYDAPKMSAIIMDEIGAFGIAPKLTKEQKLELLNELNKQLYKLKEEKSPMSGNPRMWRLQQDVKISELQEQLNQLKA